MIPNVPLLHRHDYNTGISGAKYDPFTLLLHNAKRSTETRRDSDSLIRDLLIDDISLHHEVFHWYQHHGTTIGAFLSFLRYLQERTAIDWLLKLPKKSLQKLILLRSSEKKIPLVGLNRDGTLNHSVEIKSKDFQLFRQIWHDHNLICSMFEFSTAIEEASFPKGQVLGEIAGDAVVFFCSDYNLSEPNTFEARSWFTIPENEIAFVAGAKRRLTTKAIFEGMATSNEFYAIAKWSNYLQGQKNSPITSIEFQKWEKRLWEGSYGVAIFLFAHILGIPNEKIHLFLPTFNAICDISLNPPLPPYKLSGPSNRKSWRWRELYPPFRFVQLCEATKKVGVILDFGSLKEIERFYSNICDVLKWENPLNYRHPSLSSHRHVDFDSIKFKGRFIKVIQKDISYYSYINWVQSKMWMKRMDCLPLFINFSANTGNYVDIILGEKNRKWNHPPITWTSTDQLGYAADSTDFGNWVLQTRFPNYILFDFVAGVGEYDLRAYPPDVRNSPIIGNTVRTIEHKFGVDFPFQVARI